MRAPRILGIVTGIAALFCAPTLAAPARVMSTNVCTDQLALLLALPGQLVSVSAFAADPRLSAMHASAGNLATNAGRAEEVFLLRPDLVVAADFSQHGLARFVRDAGMALEEFGYATTLDTVPADLRRMGALLGNAGEGERMAAAFEHRRAAIGTKACATRPTALVRGQNGVVQGAGTLTGSVIEAAGFDNLAAKLGFEGMTPFPLELLIAKRPDVVVLADRYDDRAASLADAVIDHPVLSGLRTLSLRDIAAPGALTCGGPFVLDVVEKLAAWRQANLPCPPDDGS